MSGMRYTVAMDFGVTVRYNGASTMDIKVIKEWVKFITAYSLIIWMIKYKDLYSDWTGVPWLNSSQLFPLPPPGDLQLQGHIVWSVWRLQWQCHGWHEKARRHRDQWPQCVRTQLGYRPQVSHFNMNGAYSIMNTHKHMHWCRCIHPQTTTISLLVSP